MADKVIDLSKFQNFWFTFILVVGYLALVISEAKSASSVKEFVLPGFSTTFITLLDISHAGYVAATVPSGNQPTVGLNVTRLATYKATGQARVNFQPRNEHTRVRALR